MSIKQITVRGARQHNLKNINVEIPRDKFTVITGLSGSGKSSLAFDTIYAEGQRRYVESLSAYARQFLDQLEKPDVDSIEGLSPAISIEQKTVSRSPAFDRRNGHRDLRLSSPAFLVDRPAALSSMRRADHAAVGRADRFRDHLDLPEGERVMILAPIVRGRKGEFKKELEKLHKDGFVRARIDGEMRQLDEEIKLDKRKNHTIEVVVDRLLMKEGVKERLTESVKTALRLTGGAVLVSIIDGEEKLYSREDGVRQLRHQHRDARAAFVLVQLGIRRVQTLSGARHGDGDRREQDRAGSQHSRRGRLKFLGGVDKAGAKFLQSALDRDHRKIYRRRQARAAD